MKISATHKVLTFKITA